MQTSLTPEHAASERGKLAESILRKCVHCGFCTATCPTYQHFGDELDGPRGRIYLIKEMLEGEQPTTETRDHLDRCLTCLACETTCPSGVDYGHLAEIGKQMVEEQVPRSLKDRLHRKLLRSVLRRRWLFTPLLRTGQLFRGLMPMPLRCKIPPRQKAGDWPARQHTRKMLLLQGCVQPAIAPRINAAAARILDRLGISLLEIPGAGCCGALSQHLQAEDEARSAMKRNIDAWWPQVEGGTEAILVTASGCGAQLRQYGFYLRNDPDYADKAERISALIRDPVEILAREDLSLLQCRPTRARVAFQTPCTLQHAGKLGGQVEPLLTRLGFECTPVPDAHLCCGSAGTYSILQPDTANALRERKLLALQSGRPERILTANIGCLTHLQAGTGMPVLHWLEALDEALQAS